MSENKLLAVQTMEIPSNLEHIKIISLFSEKNRQLSASKLDTYKNHLAQLGISLSILYQAATCHRKCFGGGHVLESLAGRTYNLATSSYILTCRGLYDEALSLIRSMGEISNIILLSVVDKEAHERWMQADKRTRLREFSPLKVRLLLEAKNEPMYADKDWYSSLCEDYTHFHSRTIPNNHDEKSGNIGGVVQDEGMKKAIYELTNLSVHIALLIGNYTQMRDMLEELEKAIDQEGENDSQQAD